MKLLSVEQAKQDQADTDAGSTKVPAGYIDYAFALEDLYRTKSATSYSYRFPQFVQLIAVRRKRPK